MARRAFAALVVGAVLLVGGCAWQVYTTDGPVARIAASPTSGHCPLTVLFDGTGSTVGAGARLASYVWDFGDGAIDEGPTVTHTYTEPGLYAVSLTVEDDLGRTDTALTTISVSQAMPVAEFVAIGEESGSGTQFKAGEEITFDGSLSHDPDGWVVDWYWDFGDGAAARGEVVVHRYRGPGCGPNPQPEVYIVTLTVRDDDGNQSSSSVLIEVMPNCGG